MKEHNETKLCAIEKKQLNVLRIMSSKYISKYMPSIKEQVQVKPSSSEWEVINVNSSHFYAEYPKCLAVSEIMCNFAVENRENGRRLGIATPHSDLGQRIRASSIALGLHRPCSRKPIKR